MPTYNYRVIVKTDTGQLNTVQCTLASQSIEMRSTDGRKTWKSSIIQLSFDGNLIGDIHIAAIPNNKWNSKIDLYDNGQQKKTVFEEDGSTNNNTSNIEINVQPN